MHFGKALFALIALVAIHGVSAEPRLGAQGAESEPNRRQQWLLPTPDARINAHAVLYRPVGDGPFPLALIAHGSTQNAALRAQMPQPEYRALAAWLVGRGYAVLVPERPGHGATGGPYLEDQGGCDNANYSRAGYATADSIKAALNYLLAEKFVRDDGVVIVGQDAGGWGALALAGEDPKVISAIVAFAAGRGGRADDTPNKVCAPKALIASADEFGDDAKIPVTWLVAANDSYFPPDLSKQLADAFRKGGDKVDFRVVPAFGSEGHSLAEADGGEKIFGPVLETALKTGRSEVGEEEMTEVASRRWPDDDVILYDGVCVFCSRWIRFIANRDVAQRFRFTAIQSPYGTRLSQTFGIDPDDPETNAVIHGGVAYFKSDAALTVLSNLPGWGWTRALRAAPKPLRDAVYGLVARNRYRIFGKYDACFLPDTDMRARVME